MNISDNVADGALILLSLLPKSSLLAAT